MFCNDFLFLVTHISHLCVLCYQLHKGIRRVHNTILHYPTVPTELRQLVRTPDSAASMEQPSAPFTSALSPHSYSAFASAF